MLTYILDLYNTNWFWFFIVIYSMMFINALVIQGGVDTHAHYFENPYQENYWRLQSKYAVNISISTLLILIAGYYHQPYYVSMTAMPIMIFAAFHQRERHTLSARYIQEFKLLREKNRNHLKFRTTISSTIFSHILYSDFQLMFDSLKQTFN